ncbi:MAG TPA: hypothetical protein VM345_09115 [Acidimicrobiales bacterium]|nr:hypothetical protein [Acidimicrobiales bacterium]
MIVALLVGVAMAFAAGGGLAQSEYPDDGGPYYASGVPAIEIYLHDAGGDAIDLYTDTGPADVRSLMNDIAHAFGAVPDEPLITDYRDFIDDFRTAGAQFDGRLARRGADTSLVFAFDTARLSTVMRRAGFESYELALCLPDVDHELGATGAIERADGFGCRRWEVVAGRPPLRIDLTLRPDASLYTKLVFGMLAAALIGAVVAALVAGTLRRSLLRSFGGAAIGVAAAGVIGAVLPALVAMTLLANFHAPVSSLVLAHGLGVGQQVAATMLPASLLAIPGTVLAVLALRAPVDLAAGGGSATRGAPPPPGAPGLPAWLDG